MRRFVHAIIVVVLSISASGAYTLVLAEPCAAAEQQEHDDAACPPTCVTCGCCVHAVEPMALSVAAIVESPLADVCTLASPQPQTSTRDILHVPKTRFA